MVHIMTSAARDLAAFTDPSDDDDFDLSSNINYLLRRAHARADQQFMTVMSGIDVTPRQGALLYGVSHAPGASISKLTQLTGMDRGTLSEMVPRLVKRGLVAQSRAEDDGRAIALTLTATGEEVLALLTQRTPELERAVLHDLPVEYRDLLVKMLSLMVGLEVETRVRT
jgi:DNA-binding MarR family transcriptional regulator